MGEIILTKEEASIYYLCLENQTCFLNSWVTVSTETLQSPTRFFIPSDKRKGLHIQRLWCDEDNKARSQVT